MESITNHRGTGRVRWNSACGYLRGGPWTRSFSITWELVGYAQSQAPPQTYRIRVLGDRAWESVWWQALRVISVLTQVWETWVWQCFEFLDFLSDYYCEPTLSSRPQSKSPGAEIHSYLLHEDVLKVHWYFSHLNSKQQAHVTGNHSKQMQWLFGV